MNEHFSRLKMKADPRQQTWDLSPNDQAAIRWANEALHALACLAADTPQFDNPLHVYAAKRIRDDILAESGR